MYRKYPPAVLAGRNGDAECLPRFGRPRLADSPARLVRTAAARAPRTAAAATPARCSPAPARVGVRRYRRTSHTRAVRARTARGNRLRPRYRADTGAAVRTPAAAVRRALLRPWFPCCDAAATTASPPVPVRARRSADG